MVGNLSKREFTLSFLFWFLFLTLTFLFFFPINSLAATQVSLAWDANSEPDLAGYRVFCREDGQSYNYNTPAWEGTTTSCTIDGLDETKTYWFVARAFDTYGLESSDSNELVLEPSTPPENKAPIADAGPDQTVDEQEAVVLSGSNSTDPDGDIASYHWVQIGEPAVTLSDPNADQPAFISPDVSPEGAALTFELTVADYDGLQSTDSCVVNVTWDNEMPQANAGVDQTVTEGSVVTLDGSGSLDIDDGIVGYSWKQVSGPVMTLSGAASDQATFPAPNVESDGVALTFELTVTDAGGLYDEDSCIVNITQVTPENQPPAAVVAPDYTETTEGTLVTMDGSGSTDPEGESLSYVWSQEEGEPVPLSDSTSAVTTFTAPKSDPFGKNIKLKLTVKDPGGLQSAVDASVHVLESEVPNTPPIADFSYDDKKKLIMFTDESTDSDGTIVSWFWELGDGNTSTEQHPSNRYVKAGNYTVKLTVTDNGGESHSSTRKIAVTKTF
jgi:PKD repeat protein